MYSDLPRWDAWANGTLGLDGSRKLAKHETESRHTMLREGGYRRDGVKEGPRPAADA